MREDEKEFARLIVGWGVLYSILGLALLQWAVYPLSLFELVASLR